MSSSDVTGEVREFQRVTGVTKLAVAVRTGTHYHLSRTEWIEGNAVEVEQ